MTVWCKRADATCTCNSYAVLLDCRHVARVAVDYAHEQHRWRRHTAVLQHRAHRVCQATPGHRPESADNLRAAGRYVRSLLTHAN